jgi:single-stranded-DNA-specific exonuclease
MQAVALLTSTDDSEAHHLAMRLDRENSARRDLERTIVMQAITQVEQSRVLRDAPVVVVHDESWHPGVVGIVASRLVERFGRPAVVIGEGGRGSGRSIERFHLFEALSAVSHTLAGFGGHAHAAGVRVKPGGVEAFRAALIDHAASVLSADDLHRVIIHDGALSIAQVDFALVQALEGAAPFGRKNPEPLFLFEDLNPTSLRELGGGHVKAIVDPARGVELIAFGAKDRIDAFRPGLAVLATPEVNTWRNTRTLQLRVKDVR